jgi:hypothetical protein
MPELKHVKRLWRPSCSAFVFTADGRQLTWAGSWRCYIIIDRASEAPRVGHELYMRYWLKGFGYIAINKAGVMMDRAPIDASVFHSSRIDFAAGPVLKDGLVRRIPAAAVAMVGELPMLDTSTIPPSAMTLKQFRDTSPLIAAARREREPEARKIREAWARQKAKEGKKKGSPKPEAELYKMYCAASERAVLGPDFVLHHAKHGEVTVGRILKEGPAAWDAERFYDPYDGKERDDPRIAGPLRFSKDGAVLHTHAHGRKTFILTNKPAAEEEFDALPEEDIAAGPGNERLTDLGNARRLVRRHGGNIRYAHQVKAVVHLGRRALARR